MIQRPVIVSLILCETVIVDEKTKHVTPVNCFRKRRVTGFPSDPFPFIVLAWLTDGMGQGRLEVVIQQLASDELDVVHQTSVPCEFTDPRSEVRFTLRIRDCVFPLAGAYEVALLADGELLGHKRLVIFSEENS